MERTLAILKPDCVRRGLVGTVISRVEAEGFRMVAARLRHLTTAQAEGFYAVHQGKAFFPTLVEFMTSGPCLTLILERDDAINHWRQVLVELRQTYTSDLTENLCHGSDAPETSDFECGFLFAGCDLR